MHPFVAALACLRLAPELGGLVLRAHPRRSASVGWPWHAAALGCSLCPAFPWGLPMIASMEGSTSAPRCALAGPSFSRACWPSPMAMPCSCPWPSANPEAVLAALQDALDRGVVTVAREGLQGTYPARFVLLAVDEGDAEEAAPERFLERLAFPFFEPAVLAPPPPCPWKRTSGRGLPDFRTPGRR